VLEVDVRFSSRSRYGVIGLRFIHPRIGVMGHASNSDRAAEWVKSTRRFGAKVAPAHDSMHDWIVSLAAAGGKTNE
jgi:hypothetical protein